MDINDLIKDAEMCSCSGLSKDPCVKCSYSEDKKMIMVCRNLFEDMIAALKDFNEESSTTEEEGYVKMIACDIGLPFDKVMDLYETVQDVKSTRKLCEFAKYNKIGLPFVQNVVRIVMECEGDETD